MRNNTLDVEAVTKMFGIAKSTVGRLVHEKCIPAYWNGRKWAFDREALTTWAESPAGKARLRLAAINKHKRKPKSVQEVRKPVATQPSDGELLSVDGVAEMLGFSVTTVRRFVQKDGIPCSRIYNTYVFERSKVEAWKGTTAGRAAIARATAGQKSYNSSFEPKPEAPVQDTDSKVRIEIIESKLNTMKCTMDRDEAVLVEVIATLQNELGIDFGDVVRAWTLGQI